jgi:hypothetical protein
MRVLIHHCLEVDVERRPSFDSIFDMFEECDFKLLPGADQRRVVGYVNGIKEWESDRAREAIPGHGRLI